MKDLTLFQSRFLNIEQLILEVDRLMAADVFICGLDLC